jgi:hypothetical protein
VVQNAGFCKDVRVRGRRLSRDFYWAADASQEITPRDFWLWTSIAFRRARQDRFPRHDNDPKHDPTLFKTLSEPKVHIFRHGSGFVVVDLDPGVFGSTSVRCNDAEILEKYVLGMCRSVEP